MVEARERLRSLARDSADLLERHGQQVDLRHRIGVRPRRRTLLAGNRAQTCPMIRLREANGMPMLQARNLSISFQGTHGPLIAVSDVSFSIAPRERVALVGESGSGKTLTGMMCLGLAPSNANVTGSVVLDGTELVGASEQQ